MGCCVSAGNRNQEAENRRSIDGEPPTSPRAILEVETVKEVLLETAVALKPMSPENQELKAEVRPSAAIAGNRDAPEKDGGDTASEVTEVSVIGSYSESPSTKAAMERSAAIDDGVVDQRPPPRKRRAHGRGRGREERVVARRVAAPPPEKRGLVASVRAVRGRPVAEENGIGSGKGKNFEEGYGRSQVRQEEVAPPPPPRKKSDQKTPAAAEAPNSVVAAGEAETLENPVVSLECFIFL